jgi:hypothetical protein
MDYRQFINEDSYVCSLEEDNDSLSDIVPSENSESEETSRNQSDEESQSSSSSELGEDEEIVKMGAEKIKWYGGDFDCQFQKKFMSFDGNKHNRDRFKGYLHYSPLELFFWFFPITFWKTIVVYTN